MIIHPDKSNFKMIWDAYIYLGLASNFFLIPFTLAFDATDSTHRIISHTYIWELIFDISFVLHILLTFLTAYQHDVEWVSSLR